MRGRHFGLSRAARAVQAGADRRDIAAMLADGNHRRPLDRLLVDPLCEPGRAQGGSPYPQRSVPKPASKPLACRHYGVILEAHRASPMPEKTYPQLCREVGLSCQECIETVARQTSRLCTGLRGKAIGQLFVQLYPHPSCSPMHAQFEAVYLQAQRKGPGREIAGAAIAVA